MKNFKGMVAFVALLAASPVVAAGTQDCGNSEACHYNDASINKGDTSNTQNVGDHQNNTYAPDSANASASNNVEIGDNIAQGGTGGSANSNGNTSTNNNASNANIGSNTQTNGNISNNVTGGNIHNAGGDFYQGSQTGGNFSQGSQTGGNVGDTIGGNAAGGNVTGGQAHTNSGSIDNTSGVSGSGNSNNNNASTASANGGKQGQQQSSNSSSRADGGKSVASGGNSRNNNTQGNRQNTNIDASQRTTIKHAANSTWAPQLNGYGPGNCFGDTNPSGSFSAGMQTFGWGVTAGSSKASNVCALAMVGGQRAAAAYLAAMDPNAHRALVAAGIVTTPSRVKAMEEARIEAQSELVASMPYRVCEIRNGRPYIEPKRGRRDEAVSACMATLGVRPAISATPVPSGLPSGVRCPDTHPVYVEGRGCRK